MSRKFISSNYYSGHSLKPISVKPVQILKKEYIPGFLKLAGRMSQIDKLRIKQKNEKETQ